MAPPSATLAEVLAYREARTLDITSEARKAESASFEFPQLKDATVTVISGSRDPWDSRGTTIDATQRPEQVLAASIQELDASESLANERLALVVRKQVSGSLTREEQARLLLLTRKLEGFEEPPNAGGPLQRVASHLDEFDLEIARLDALLGA